ncbi:MAG: anti-sigma factor [Patescibacteria group bacterium]|nr:anti-sigma factor [Patescibacteria group bacterium]
MAFYRKVSALDLALAVCILAVVTGAGYVAYRVFESKNGSLAVNIPPISSGLFPVDGPAILGESDSSDTPNASPTIARPRKASPVKPGKADPKFMEKLKSRPGTVSVTMTDVIGSNTRAYALVSRHDGQLYAGVRAFVPLPPEGSFYQGWIMKKYPRKMYVPLGVFELQKDGTFLLTKTITPTYPDFKHLVITIESTGDRLPERHVLEGPIPE